MDSISHLRAINQLQALESYHAKGYARTQVEAANPMLTATLGQRDPGRGHYQLVTANGGSLTANLIGGIVAPGAVMPSVSTTAAGSFADGS